MKRFAFFALLVSIALTIPAYATPKAPAAVDASEVKTPKYIFLFIGDGMGKGHVAATEAFKKATQNAPLSFTAFPACGEIFTKCADKPVTDSAAAGTALACGAKANYHAVGIDPKGKSLTSVSTVAKAAGMRVGITIRMAFSSVTPSFGWRLTNVCVIFTSARSAVTVSRST